MIIGIDVVFFHAKNPRTLSKWYNTTLGLKIGFVTDDHSWNEFEFDEERPPTRLAIEYEGSSPSVVEKQRIMVSFRVVDIHSTIRELENRGVVFYGAPKVVEEGQSLFATFQDPEGNWLQISQRIRK